MQKYFLKLNPPRPTFMMAHIVYWNQLLEDGIAIVFGRK